jgi:hypothetical protein
LTASLVPPRPDPLFLPPRSNLRGVSPFHSAESGNPKRKPNRNQAKGPMKTTCFLLLLPTLTMALLAAPIAAAAEAQSQAAVAKPPGTPRFDGFLQDLDHCRWDVTRWVKVLHPKLVELKYTKGEITVLRKGLQKKQITLEQAAGFCSKWEAFYGEKLDPRQICAFLMGRPEKELAGLN